MPNNDTRNYKLAILGLAVALAINIVRQATAEPRVEVRYVPEEVIVERIIQTETIAVPDEALADLVREALDTEFEDVMSHIEDLNMEVAALQRIAATGQGSQVVVPVVCDDEGVTPVDEVLDVAFDDVSVPVARVQLASNGVLTASAYDLSLELNTVVTEANDGSLSTVSGLSLFSQGQEYEVPIEGTTYYNLATEPEPDTERRFRFWNPYIDLSVDAGLWSDPFRVRPGASLGFSTSSINRGEQPVWRFVRAGVGFSTDQNAYFSITPATYNLGRALPVFDDLWLGPGIGINTGGNYIITLGLGTTL